MEETEKTWQERQAEDFALLKEDGWEVECESPLEIRHADGSFASGYAANVVLDSIKYENSHLYTKDQMGDTFRAGYERGIFVASIITRNPIDGHYPGFDEHMKKYEENE